MTTLPEIAAEARRMAAWYRRQASHGGPYHTALSAAADFDRLAEMAERSAPDPARTFPETLGYDDL